MAEHKCRQRRRYIMEATVVRSVTPPMEVEDMGMNRYISPHPPAPCGCGVPGCELPCGGRENRILLEQLTELTAEQNQLLVDLLGAVGALTAALLTTQARV